MNKKLVTIKVNTEYIHRDLKLNLELGRIIIEHRVLIEITDLYHRYLRPVNYFTSVKQKVETPRTRILFQTDYKFSTSKCLRESVKKKNILTVNTVPDTVYTRG